MKFTEAERRRIAEGWSSATCDQPTYAAQHGVSPRTLRAWVEKYGTGQRPEVRVRAVVQAALKTLHDVLAMLDAAEACQVGTEGRSAEVGVADDDERHAGPAATEVPTAPPPSARTPMPAAGFFF